MIIKHRERKPHTAKLFHNTIKLYRPKQAIIDVHGILIIIYKAIEAKAIIRRKMKIVKKHEDIMENIN